MSIFILSAYWMRLLKQKIYFCLHLDDKGDIGILFQMVHQNSMRAGKSNQLNPLRHVLTSKKQRMDKNVYLPVQAFRHANDIRINHLMKEPWMTFIQHSFTRDK